MTRGAGIDIRRSVKRPFLSHAIAFGAVVVASALPARLAFAQQPGASGGAPTSTSGTDVTPPSDAAPLLGTDRDAAGTSAKTRDLEARLAEDEIRLKALEDDLGPLRHLKIQGYVQLQYTLQSYNAAGSPNLRGGRLPPGIGSNDSIANPNGTTTNSNMFRLRRTRVRAIYETDVTRVFLEADLLPAGGPAATQNTIARNAEATGIANWTPELKTEFTAGLFQVPFLPELVESSMVRPFIERTWTAQNLFPTERDLGVHAKTVLRKRVATLDVGILNGQRLGEKLFVLQSDLNSSKDFYAAATATLGPITLSLAGYLGRGQLVDSQLVRVKNYGRLGADIGLKAAYAFVPKLGETKLLSELVFGRNMDTGVNYAFAVPVIPAAFGSDVQDVNERGFYVRAEQELTKWGIAGLRYDMYTPSSAIANNARDTYTLMLGARFSKYLRLINEASYAIDNAHPEGTAAPSRHVFTYSAWVQGSFY